LLDPEVKGKAATGYLWFYSHPKGDVFLEFCGGRGREGPEKRLTDFQGTIQTDAYAVYDSLRKQRPAVLKRLGCLAHIRRKWYKAAEESCTEAIRAIPFKRYPKPMVGYLLREEIEAILAATEDTWTGSRDYLLFLLLYNTGARISEILKLRVRDVLGSEGRSVQLQGKGRKFRTLPLWPKTRRCLRLWIKQNNLVPESPLLPNRFGHVLTRSGAAKQLQELIDRAKDKLPSLKKRRISLHQIRHATAMHMCEAGVSAEIIALWLGHESPTTTHGYVEASMAMKKRALENLPSPQAKAHKLRLDDSLLCFLENL
jgi:integrase